MYGLNLQYKIFYPEVQDTFISAVSEFKKINKTRDAGYLAQNRAPVQKQAVCV